jgi:hypothetical protein
MKYTIGRSKLNQNQQNAIGCIEHARNLMRDVIGNPKFSDQLNYIENAINSLELYGKYRESCWTGSPSGKILQHKVPDRCQKWVNNKLKILKNKTKE